MGKRKHDFRKEDMSRILLWCRRHCCLCGKFSGTGIEIAHLDNESSDIEDAIPVCFDCHAAIGHYNDNHPKGKKYAIEELKKRRNQIYELHTRPLVPPIEYYLTQEGHKLPDVGFFIINRGATYPVKARVKITFSKGMKTIRAPKLGGHYKGQFLLNLNPQFGFKGHFKIPRIAMKNKKVPLCAKCEIIIYDIYDREHSMLPGGYVKILENDDKDWYFEPSIDEYFPKRRTGKLKQ